MNRFWVGNSGSWNDVSHWSDTSGGVSGATIPTSGDSVYFDSNSFSINTQVVSIDVLASCLDMNWSGITNTVTLSSSVYSLNIYGSLVLWSGLTWTFTGTAYTYFKATDSRTITTNDISLSNWINFNGVGGNWTNQDSFNLGGSRTILYNGTWNTNNKNIYWGELRRGSGTFTWNIGSSICSGGNGLLFSGTNDVGLTINAGTSTINCVGGWLSGGGKTYYKLTQKRTGNSIMGGTGGGFTCYDLDIIPTAGVYGNFNFSNDITVNNILTISGYTSTNQRLLINSNSIGTQRTITANVVIASNVDFKDIKFTTPLDLSNINGGSGDCGGNTNITFTTAVPQYFKHTSGAVNWSDSTKWFTSSGGLVQGRVPLPQDSAIFDENSFSETSNLTVNVPRIGSLDMSLINTGITMLLYNDIECYGDFIASNNIIGSITNSRYTYFLGKSNNTYNINLYDKLIYGLAIYTNANYNFLSGFEIGYFLSFQGSGIINLGSYTYTFNLSNSTVYSCFSNVLLNTETSTFKFTQITGGVNLTGFNGGGKIYNKIWLVQSTFNNYLNIYSSNTFNEILIDGGRKIKFVEGTTQIIGKLTAVGTLNSGVTITSTTSGLTHNLIITGSTDVRYANISYSNITPTTAGQYSFDGGGNTGWIFDNFTYRKIIVQPNNKIMVDSIGRILW